MNKIENQILVIFGASGDLTKRKLIPAIFDLYNRGFFSDNFAILGVSRTDYSDESFREEAVIKNEHLISKNRDREKEIGSFAKLLHYECTDTSNLDDYQKLKERIGSICSAHNCSNNCIFYLSIPPSLYATVSENIAGVGLNEESDGWKRLIVEKPFGYDLKSAQELNQKLLACFDEHQIYRIDHYLGKETVQNLLVTRFSNTIFEPLWNRNYIERVEITNAESVGVEKRGGYYDNSGALRDMVQNHLLQLVSHVAMEPPSRVDADSIRNEKNKLFESIRHLSEEEIRTQVIRGQYLSSTIQDEFHKGYREEEGVDPESRTETYVAMKFFIDNWRWADVPFYVRSGKRLPTRVSEVVIKFKPNHTHLFAEGSMAQNILVFRIQPNEGILLKTGLKVPGAGFNVENVNMDFMYDELTDAYVPDAYERLLLDCMQGDATLYARGDSVLAAWKFIDPILTQWKNDNSIPIYGYPSGTCGPEQTDLLIENGVWRNPCKNLIDDGLYCEL
jgi:glucose-6-phosphate 1-dehydrogenase